MNEKTYFCAAILFCSVTTYRCASVLCGDRTSGIPSKWFVGFSLLEPVQQILIAIVGTQFLHSHQG